MFLGFSLRNLNLLTLQIHILFAIHKSMLWDRKGMKKSRIKINMLDTLIFLIFEINVLFDYYLSSSLTVVERLRIFRVNKGGWHHSLARVCAIGRKKTFSLDRESGHGIARLMQNARQHGKKCVPQIYIYIYLFFFFFYILQRCFSGNNSL